MASSTPEHHVDRVGHRLGDCYSDFVLAAEKRLNNADSTIETYLVSMLHVQPRASISP
jgi:hypothetical protein